MIDNGMVLIPMRERIPVIERYKLAFPELTVTKSRSGNPERYIDCEFALRFSRESRQPIVIGDPPSDVRIETGDWGMQVCCSGESPGIRDNFPSRTMTVGERISVYYGPATGRFIRCKFTGVYINPSMITDGNTFVNCHIFDTKCTIDTVSPGKHAVDYRGNKMIVRDGEMRRPGDFGRLFIKNFKFIVVGNIIGAIRYTVRSLIILIVSMFTLSAKLPKTDTSEIRRSTIGLMMFLISCGDVGEFNLRILGYVFFPIRYVLTFVFNLIESQLLSVTTALKAVMKPMHKKWNCYWCVENETYYRGQRQVCRTMWVNMTMTALELPVVYLAGYLLGARLIVTLLYGLYATTRITVFTAIKCCNFWR